MRQSISIATAAEVLDTSKDTVRDMLDKGQLSGHYLRRERRVYIDSITEYQQAHEIKVTTQETSGLRKRRAVTGKTDASRTLAEFGI